MVHSPFNSLKGIHVLAQKAKLQRSHCLKELRDLQLIKLFCGSSPGLHRHAETGENLADVISFLKRRFFLPVRSGTGSDRWHLSENVEILVFKGYNFYGEDVPKGGKGIFVSSFTRGYPGLSVTPIRHGQYCSLLSPAELTQPPAPPLVPKAWEAVRMGSAASWVCCGQSSWSLPCSQCQSAQRWGCPVFHGLPSLAEVWVLAIYPCSSQRESYGSKIIKIQRSSISWETE